MLYTKLWKDAKRAIETLGVETQHSVTHQFLIAVFQQLLMLTVDTNILVYAADADSPFHAGCREWLERQRGRADAWYTTWSILYEFLRVTTHPRVMRRPWNISDAWNFVQALLASPGLGILVPTQRHPMVAEQIIGEIPHLAGNLLTTRIQPSSCVSTESARFAPETSTFTVFLFSKSSIPCKPNKKPPRDVCWKTSPRFRAKTSAGFTCGRSEILILITANRERCPPC
jgi:toxin-antitoxin system PIN domain toxin